MKRTTRLVLSVAAGCLAMGLAFAYGSSVRAEAEQDEVREAALADEKVAAAIEGKNVVKFVYIKGRLANIVVK